MPKHRNPFNSNPSHTTAKRRTASPYPSLFELVREDRPARGNHRRHRPGTYRKVATRFHDTPITVRSGQWVPGTPAPGGQKSPASIAAALSAIKFISRHTGTPIDFLLADTTLKGIKRNAEAQARGRGQATGIKVNDAMTMATIADSRGAHIHQPPAKRHLKRRGSGKRVMRPLSEPCQTACSEFPKWGRFIASISPREKTDPVRFSSRAQRLTRKARGRRSISKSAQ